MTTTPDPRPQRTSTVRSAASRRLPENTREITTTPSPSKNKRQNRLGSPELPRKITTKDPIELGTIRITPLTSSRTLKKKASVKMGLRQVDKAAVVISEIDESGSVPFLHAENPTKHYMLFIEGDQLIGAKQNRVCNSTVLMQPNSTARLPVSCVEEGRWRHVSRHFGSSKFHASPALRRKITKTKEATRRDTQGRQVHSAHQGQVWSHIVGFAEQAGVQSKTMAVQDVYEAREIEMQNQLLENPTDVGKSEKPQNACIECPKGIHGWILETPDGGVSIDLFGTPKLCRQAWKRIIGSAAIEAMIYQKHSHSKLQSRSNLKSRKAVKQLINTIQKTPLERVEPVAAGIEQRFADTELSGAYLTLHNRVVHLGLTI